MILASVLAGAGSARAAAATCLIGRPALTDSGAIATDCAPNALAIAAAGRTGGAGTGIAGATAIQLADLSRGATAFSLLRRIDDTATRRIRPILAGEAGVTRGLARAGAAVHGFVAVVRDGAALAGTGLGDRFGLARLLVLAVLSAAGVLAPLVPLLATAAAILGVCLLSVQDAQQRAQCGKTYQCAQQETACTGGREGSGEMLNAVKVHGIAPYS